MDPSSTGTYSKLVDFEDKFRDTFETETFTSKLKTSTSKWCSRFTCRLALLTLLDHLPIITTIRTYKVKEYLVNDLGAGLISGVLMLPQGMAFAALSTLPPILGLYITFFSSISYAILGTGRQVSWGCSAVLSLMYANVLFRYEDKMASSHSPPCINESFTESSSQLWDVSGIDSSPSRSIHDAVTAKKIELLGGMTFIGGLILVIASKLGLSRLTNLMSNSLITGFSVGASFLVVTSQLKGIFGLSIPRLSGHLPIINTWIAVAINIKYTNVATLVISISSILTIYLVKKFVNERFEAKMRVPIPIELFVVIITTLVSAHYTELSTNYNVEVLQDVPVGVPAPRLPDLSEATDYILDSVIVIVVSYSQSVAVSKIMGLKHKYFVDPHQEMNACGINAMICGLFSGYTASALVSRTIVQDGAGGKTQIASLFAASLVLLVLMLIGPYFYYLPMCVLSAIIVVNLRPMFLKLLDIPAEWEKSKYDCSVWVFCCVATILFNPALGLLTAVGFSCMLVLLRSMFDPVVEAGLIQRGPKTEELRSLDLYSAARKLDDVKILKINTPLYFINADIFSSKIFSKTGLDPLQMKKKQELSMEQHENGTFTMMNIGRESEDMVKRKKSVSTVMLDMAGVSFIDLMGVQALQFVVNEYRSVDIQVIIFNVPEPIIPMLKSTGFWKKNREHLFLSLDTALAALDFDITFEEKT